MYRGEAACGEVCKKIKASHVERMLYVSYRPVRVYVFEGVQISELSGIELVHLKRDRHILAQHFPFPPAPSGPPFTPIHPTIIAQSLLDTLCLMSIPRPNSATSCTDA